MKWARAESVLRRAASALANLATARTAAATTATGPVTSTAPRLPRSGTLHVDLTARAIRKCNRCPKATALYLAKIEALRAGPSS